VFQKQCCAIGRWARLVTAELSDVTGRGRDLFTPPGAAVAEPRRLARRVRGRRDLQREWRQLCAGEPTSVFRTVGVRSRRLMTRTRHVVGRDRAYAGSLLGAAAWVRSIAAGHELGETAIKILPRLTSDPDLVGSRGKKY